MKHHFITYNPFKVFEILYPNTLIGIAINSDGFLASSRSVSRQELHVINYGLRILFRGELSLCGRELFWLQRGGKSLE